MAFMSLMIMGISVVMGVIGLVLLLAALILFLVNRRRKTQGQEKKQKYKIAGVVCLVLGCINLAPLLFFFLRGTVGRKVTTVANQAKLKTMPERAVLYREGSDTGEKNEAAGEEQDTWKDDLDEWELGEEIVEYQGKEYVAVSADPDIRMLKLSEPKAYLQYRDVDEEAWEDAVSFQEIVYEVENQTGFDLLGIGVEGDSPLDGVEVNKLYCLRDQHEDLEQTYRAGAEYYLEQSQGGELDSRRVSEAGFQLADLGIDDAFLDRLDDKQGETLADYPKKEYDLRSTGMDGLLSDYSTTIGKYEGKWYCYSIFAFGEIEDAHLLPEKGQRYMDALG